MEVMAIPLLSLLLARPPDYPSPPAKNLFAVLLSVQYSTVQQCRTAWLTQIICCFLDVKDRFRARLTSVVIDRLRMMPVFPRK